MNELMSLIAQSEDFDLSSIEVEEFLYGEPYGAEKDYDEADGISAEFTLTIQSTIERRDSDDKNDFRID
jgi:hypothetical protein